MDKKEINDTIRELMETVLLSIKFPTGENILFVTGICVITLVVSIISTLLDFYTFVSWQGALIATLYMAILLFIERREEYEISRLYSDVKSRVEQFKCRTAKANTSVEDIGSDDSFDES